MNQLNKSQGHQHFDIFLPKLFKVLTWLLILGIWLPAAHAQLKGLTINAQKISFEKEKNIVEAEGSVEVAYKDVYLFGNHLIYNTSAEVFFADRGFSLLYEGITIEGDSLNYILRKKEGRASKVDFIYQGIRLQAEKIYFDLDKFVMNYAGFTTCGLLEPHYRVTASEISLYPKTGWLVAYWGFFWLGKFPVLPLPTYIYDFRAEERAHKNLPPFPEVGSNPEDGLHFKERITWYLHPGLSGNWGVGWATSKGLLLGFYADYFLTDQSRGDLHLDWNPTNQLVGGVTHRFLFGKELKAKAIAPFLVAPKLWQYQLEATLSYHERINYQRVSYYPKLALISFNHELAEGRAKFDFELSAAMVAEEGNTKLAEGGGKIKIYQDFSDPTFGKLTPSLVFDGWYYSNGEKWLKPSLGLNLEKSFNDKFHFQTDYLHYFEVKGQSPFNFENYRFRAVDRLKPHLFLVWGETGIGISASYYLDNWSPEDIDYSLFFKMHCYNLAMTYRSLRNEFALGFSLTQ
ncbi:MAG: hypothetical protein ACPL4K_01520 [Candidatus Margulisiibacteriota bacterium]